MKRGFSEVASHNDVKANAIFYKSHRSSSDNTAAVDKVEKRLISYTVTKGGVHRRSVQHSARTVQ